MSQVPSPDDQDSTTDSLIVVESATMLEVMLSRFAVIVTAPEPMRLTNRLWPSLGPAARVMAAALAALISDTLSVGAIAPLVVYVFVVA
jgi:hypothetical protein